MTEIKTAAAKKIKAKRARRPIYGTWTKVVIAETGEERIAWVSSHPIGSRLLKERGWKRGVECRAEFKRSRNVKFYRLGHSIGMLLVDNVEAFRDMDGHDALKKVQADSGVCCDVEKFVIDLGTFGRHEVDRNIPRSLAFDEMEEGEFGSFFIGITNYIGDTYASVMLDEVRDEFWDMVKE